MAAHSISETKEDSNGGSPGDSHADENLVNVTNEAGAESIEWIHEILEIEEGQENSPEYNRNMWENCKKNPGHSEFKCVDDIKSHPLLKDYKDDDLFQLIKLTADLTVKIETGFVSQARPELDPVSKKKYPLYNKGGKYAKGVGTGLIINIEDILDTSFISNTPRDVVGNVTMTTSKHVVFDQTEADHISCTLFFDKEDSSVVTLAGWTISQEDIMEDKCELKCPIYDKDLQKKLVKSWCEWTEPSSSIYKKYINSDLKNWIFIVSHPHGYIKQVTLGKLVKKSEEEGEWDNCTFEYTTGTCPGSSGAHVFSLAIPNSYCYSHHAHKGVNAAGNNYSGIGKKKISIKYMG